MHLHDPPIHPVLPTASHYVHCPVVHPPSPFVHSPAISSHSLSPAASPSVIPPLVASTDLVIVDVFIVSLPSDRPKRQTKTPSYLSNYHCALLQTSHSLSPNHTTPYPLSSLLFTYPYCAYLHTFSHEIVPKTFLQAMASE